MADNPGANISIQTTAQSIANRINTWSATLLNLGGILTSDLIEADTLVFTGIGRLVSITIVDPGSADGAIYNFNSVTSPPAEKQMYAIDTTAEKGVYPLGLNFTAGLVVIIGTGQKVSVTYSPNPPNSA